MGWKWSQMVDLIWPEVIVAGGMGITHVFSRALDVRMGLEKPFRRTSDYLHSAAIGGGAIGVATTREGSVGNDACKALVLSDLPLITESLAATLVEEVASKRGLTATGARKGVNERKAIVEAERILQAARVEAARLIAAAKGGHNPGALIPVGQYANDEILA